MTGPRRPNCAHGHGLFLRLGLSHGHMPDRRERKLVAVKVRSHSEQSIGNTYKNIYIFIFLLKEKCILLPCVFIIFMLNFLFYIYIIFKITDYQKCI